MAQTIQMHVIEQVREVYKMSFQDPTGETLTSGNVGVPPLVGYAADSTLSTENSPISSNATSATIPVEGSDFALDEASADATGISADQLDGWNWPRTGMITGVVVAGLAIGAGTAWYLISRRRGQSQAVAVRQAAQAGGWLSRLSVPSLAFWRSDEAQDTPDDGVGFTDRARQTAQTLSASAIALAEQALAAAQDARDRAIAASQLIVDQTQTAQDTLADTWGRTVDTASTSWNAAAKTAQVARDATRHSVDVARDAAQQTADIIRAESRRTARTARSGWRNAQRAATR